MVNQQVNFVNVLLATPSYFLEGTDYKLPLMKNALVLSQLSSNVSSGTSYIDDNKRYASQHISFQIYPNKSGVFSIPSMSFTVATVADNKGKQYQKEGDDISRWFL
ncbi:BatD family protein [Vibrio sp. SS-MA-C1-2]|uniref:BatD family protein n=1 Tax=Vibrio sp. SS-MA-C1-2 TaxID=2908646 RepID=UPI001F18601D|nr:BatD family protein [Vibrio sp. SS-MA-C1-2]UJF17085.1 BatD family protein [Vibrio sp. SS-MA-C1-2]